MKEMYNNYEEEEDDWDLPEDKDPFQEDVDTEVNIGTVQVKRHAQNQPISLVHISLCS